MVESIRSLQAEAGHSIEISVALLGEKCSGAKRTVLDPDGVILVDWPDGKTTSMSLSELSSEQIVPIFREVVRAF